MRQRVVYENKRGEVVYTTNQANSKFSLVLFYEPIKGRHDGNGLIDGKSGCFLWVNVEQLKQEKDDNSSN